MPEFTVVMKASDIAVKAVNLGLEHHHYRTPIKFGGVALDRATVLNVWLDVETAGGNTARGFGSMPPGNVWSFPSRQLSYDQTLTAMRVLADRIAALLEVCRERGHPIDLTWALEPEFLKAAEGVRRELALAEPIPVLGGQGRRDGSLRRHRLPAMPPRRRFISTATTRGTTIDPAPPSIRAPGGAPERLLPPDPVC